MSGISYRLIIDIAAGTKRFAGKQNLYMKSLLSFADRLPGEKYDFDSPEALKEVHAIKGVAGNLSINSLYEIAIECELLMRQAPDEAAYNRFYDACAATGRALLEKFDNRIEPKANTLPLGTREEYTALISRLKIALTIADASDCEDVTSNLRLKNWATAVNIEKLCKLVEAYEFDAALELLK